MASPATLQFVYTSPPQVFVGDKAPLRFQYWSNNDNAATDLSLATATITVYDGTTDTVVQASAATTDSGGTSRTSYVVFDTTGKTPASLRVVITVTFSGQVYNFEAPLLLSRTPRGMVV